MNDRPFTVADFRRHIASIIGVNQGALKPGGKVRFKNSVPECCRRRKGDAPTPSETLAINKGREAK